MVAGDILGEPLTSDRIEMLFLLLRNFSYKYVLLFFHFNQLKIKFCANLKNSKIVCNDHSGVNKVTLS